MLYFSGQLLYYGTLYNSYYLLAIIVVLAGVYAGVFKKQYIFSLVILGSLSATLHLKPLEIEKSLNVQGLKVSLNSVPKIKRNRSLSLDLMIEDRAYHKLNHKRMLCRSASSPDRNINQLRAGDTFYFAGNIKSLNLNNSFDRRLSVLGYSAKCDVKFLGRAINEERTFLTSLREDISRQVSRRPFTEDVKSIFLSMSFGIDKDLSLRDWRVFKETGLAHLLVVSGYQVTLVYLLVSLLFFKLMASFRKLATFLNIEIIASVFGLLLAFLYALTVGLDSACRRAVIGLSVLFLAKMFQREVSFVNIIFTTLLFDLSISPLCLLLPGTQLTYAALFGLSFAGMKRGVGAYVNACLMATLFSSVVVMFWFKEFYLISFISNLILAPLGSIIACQLGFLGLIFSKVDLTFLLDLSLGLIQIYISVVVFLQETFSSNLYSVGMLVVSIMMVFLMLVLKINRFILIFNLKRI